MLEFTSPKYTQRVQELVDAINEALFEMNTRDWPTLLYQFEGKTSRRVRLAIVHIASRNDGDGPYYMALLSNKSRTIRSSNAITLAQHDLDHIAKQVGINVLDYEAT